MFCLSYVISNKYNFTSIKARRFLELKKFNKRQNKDTYKFHTIKAKKVSAPNIRDNVCKRPTISPTISAVDVEWICYLSLLNVALFVFLLIIREDLHVVAIKSSQPKVQSLEP